MTCERLRLWAEGEEEGARPPELLEHLKECAHCRSVWPELLALEDCRVQAGMGTTPSALSPVDLPRVRRRSRAVRVSIGVGVSAAGLLLMVFLRNDPEPLPSEADTRAAARTTTVPLTENAGEARHSRALLSISGKQRITSEVQWTHVTPTLPAWARRQKQ